jgi:hypothetical protein
MLRKFSWGFAAIVAVFGALEVEAQRGPVAPAPGRLEIKNVTWNQVRIEVRVGGSTNCEQNPVVATKVLRKGRTWSISGTRWICWRRELAPGQLSVNAWTDWSKRMVPARTVMKTTA